MRTPSILIVEDEAIVAADLANRLQQLGYRVAGSVASGEQAVARVREQPPDLVLMDIRLTGVMDGVAAAEVIRRECDLPVVFLTAHSDATTLDRAKIAEPFGYIIKPFEERELRTTIEMGLYKHQADRQVREQREWFRVTLASIGDAVIACDTERRITFVNPMAETITGWTTQEVLGQPIQRVLRLINEQNRQPYDDPVGRVLGEGRPAALANHTALISRDGREVPIEDSAAPILDAAGRVIGAVLVFHDVTEKRRAEEALAAAHQRRIRILESLGEGFFALDRDYQVTFVNERGAEVLGKSRAELLNRSLWESFPEAVGSGFHRAYEQAMAGQVSVSVEEFYPPLNAWFEARADPSPEGLSVFYRNVTGRKQAEETLRRSQEDLNHAQAVAHTGSWRLDVEHNTLIWSDETHRIFGIPQGTPLTYETFLDAVHPEDRATVDQKWTAALRGEPYDIEHRIVVGEQVKWVRERAELEFGAQGSLRGGFGTVQDITERRQVEAAQAFLIRCGYETSGEDFFHSLARYLARSLSMDYVCIDRLQGDGLAAETVAVYSDGGFQDNVVYALKDTPCGDAVGKTICCFPAEVRRLFPRDQVLQDLVAESYVGTTLWSYDGKPIGLIALIGRKPLQDPDLAQSVLKAVAERAAGELERLRAEQALQQAHDELEVRVEQRTHDLAEAVARLEAEVAARTRVEAELRETEERYRTLFAAAPVGIALTDASGRVRDANAALCAMLGFTLSEMQASPASSFYAKPAEGRRLMRRVRQETRVEDFETTLRRKDGTQFLASLKLNWIQLRQQQLFLTLVTDLTQRRHAERQIKGIVALQELFVTQVTREEYLEAVAHYFREWAGCAAAGIRLLDNDGRLPFVVSVGFTRAFVKQEGQFRLDTAPCPCLPALRKTSEPTDRPYTRIQSTILRNGLGEIRKSADAEGAELTGMPCVIARYASVAHAPIHYGDRLLGIIQLADRQDGKFPLETAQFLDSAAPLVGEALHRFGLEAELRESEERFRSLFERHQAVMLLVDPESGAIVDANESAERFYGFPRGHLTTLSIQDLSVRPPPAVRSEAADGGDGRDRRAVFLQRLANGDTRMVEVHSSPIAVRERTLLFSIIEDITERRRLERQVLDIGDRERQRIGRDLHDSLGGGLSGLAMLGKALAQSLTRSSIPEAAIAEEIVHGINEAVGRTRAIARGLCPVGLSAFGFVNGLEELALGVEKRHRVECQVRAPRDVVIAEDLVASHLFQIVEEAINNAIRHGHPRKIEITVDHQPRGLLLRVRDDGVGLPKDIDRSPGMGLRTMRYRAGVIGATLEIQSPPTGGTVVSCIVAASGPPGDASAPTPHPP